MTYPQTVELDQAMAYVELSTGSEFLTAYEYARLSGVEMHPITPLEGNLPCPDATVPAEFTTPANNAADPTDAESSAPTAE
jgi:hypothetical protein